MLYFLIRTILRVVFRVVFRWRIYGEENIPAEGPVLVAANHVSFLDPPVVGCAISRKVHFMAKAELFKYPVLGWLFRSFGAFPVRRGAADRTAIKMALDLLKQGEVIGIFPEGTRNRTGQVLAPQHGVALLAIKADASIVPAAVTGTTVRRRILGIPVPSKVIVRIGKPISVAEYDGRVDKDTITELSQKVMKRIRELM